MRSRLPHLAAVAAVLVFLAVPEAHADLLTPESGPSKNANDIDTLYKITLYLGIAVFVGVWGTLIYSLVKFRARRDGPEPAQIRGNTPLEISWTLGAAGLLVILATITFVMLPGIKDPPSSLEGGLEAAEGVSYATVDQKEPPDGSPLRIRVNGQNFIWRYEYADEDRLYSYHELVVPVNTTVTLEITSQDVIHSWWVPKLGGKVDAMPGHVNETWFRAEEVGDYSGACGELCGEGHAEMRTRVRVVPLDEYEAWVEEQSTGIAEAFEGLAEQRRERRGDEDEVEGDSPENDREDGGEGDQPGSQSGGGSTPEGGDPQSL